MKVNLNMNQTEQYIKSALDKLVSPAFIKDRLKRRLVDLLGKSPDNKQAKRVVESILAELSLRGDASGNSVTHKILLDLYNKLNR